MFALRRWSVRHARFLRGLYGLGEAVAATLVPLARLIPTCIADHA